MDSCPEGVSSAGAAVFWPFSFPFSEVAPGFLVAFPPFPEGVLELCPPQAQSESSMTAAIVKAKIFFILSVLLFVKSILHFRNERFIITLPAAKRKFFPAHAHFFDNRTKKPVAKV